MRLLLYTLATLACAYSVYAQAAYPCTTVALGAPYDLTPFMNGGDGYTVTHTVFSKKTYQFAICEKLTGSPCSDDHPQAAACEYDSSGNTLLGTIWKPKFAAIGDEGDGVTLTLQGGADTGLCFHNSSLEVECNCDAGVLGPFSFSYDSTVSCETKVKISHSDCCPVSALPPPPPPPTKPPPPPPSTTTTNTGTGTTGTSSRPTYTTGGYSTTTTSGSPTTSGHHSYTATYTPSPTTQPSSLSTTGSSHSSTKPPPVTSTTSSPPQPPAPPKDCGKHKTCFDCQEEPKCAWNETANTCAAGTDFFDCAKSCSMQTYCLKCQEDPFCGWRKHEKVCYHGEGDTGDCDSLCDSRGVAYDCTSCQTSSKQCYWLGGDQPCRAYNGSLALTNCNNLDNFASLASINAAVAGSVGAAVAMCIIVGCITVITARTSSRSAYFGLFVCICFCMLANVVFVVVSGVTCTWAEVDVTGAKDGVYYGCLLGASFCPHSKQQGDTNACTYKLYSKSPDLKGLATGSIAVVVLLALCLVCDLVVIGGFIALRNQKYPRRNKRTGRLAGPLPWLPTLGFLFHFLISSAIVFLVTYSAPDYVTDGTMTFGVAVVLIGGSAILSLAAAGFCYFLLDRDSDVYGHAEF